MHRNGFTILETIVFSAIFLIIVSALYLMYETSHTTVTRGQNKVEVQQNAWGATAKISREIRMAGYDPSDVITTLPTTAVETANTNDVTFVGDVDGDGNTDRVRYRVQGTQIIRDFSSWNGAAFPAFASSELADGVNTLAFTYFDANDNTTATLADIRRISIDVTTQETAAGRPESFALSTDVWLRNPGE